LVKTQDTCSKFAGLLKLEMGRRSSSGYFGFLKLFRRKENEISKVVNYKTLHAQDKCLLHICNNDNIRISFSLFARKGCKILHQPRSGDDIMITSLVAQFSAITCMVLA
jgi:hypothetical protein